MSWLSKAKDFVFSGIFAQAARAASSSNAAQSAAGNAALSAVTTGPTGQAIKAVALSTAAAVATDVGAALTAHKSPTGIANAVVGDLEDGAKLIVDSFVASLAGGVPLIGGLIAPEAVKLVNLGLDFGEQHALTYVAALFAHHRAVVASSVAPAAEQAAQPATGAVG